MEWQIFALLQMALIMIGVGLAFGLNNRKLSQQNDQLRQTLDAQSAQTPDPADLIKKALENFPQDDPLQPVYQAVLNNAVQPEKGFSEKLRTLLSESGADNSATLQARIEELEKALAESAGPSVASEDGEQVEADELKSLLQQFTHDSREMMACIAELEHENAKLKQQLEADEAQATTAPATEEQDQQSPEPGDTSALDESIAEQETA